jgi:hypothetical protein
MGLHEQSSGCILCPPTDCPKASLLTAAAAVGAETDRNSTFLYGFRDGVRAALVLAVEIAIAGD